MIAYGLSPVQRPYVSHLMGRDTAGRRQNYKYTHRNIRYEKPADSRGFQKRQTIYRNYETDHRANRQGGKSSRTMRRSTPMALHGSALVIAGRLVPVLGFAYAYSDLMKGSDDSEIYQGGKRINQQSYDTISSFANTAGDIAFRPKGPVQTIANIALWSVLS